MRQKINDLLIYHSNLDSKLTIDLLKAFEDGNLNYIRKYITTKNVNNSIGVCCYQPLELAIIFDHKHIFDYLVYDLNVNINIKNKSLETMPFVALAFQRRDLLFELLNLDTSNLYDCTSQSQRTLMHEAAINQDSETVYKLLNEFGFYKNLNEFELSHLLYDKYGCTPLYYASWFGCTDIAEQLLDCCSDTKESDQDDVFSDDPNSDKPSLVRFEDSSLSISILYKRFDCVKLLLTKCTNMNCITTMTKLKLKNLISTELDCWISTSMKLDTCVDFIEMCNIFHELVLNGAKFSNYIFTLLDSMNELKQFKFLNNNLNNGFSYNLFCSYFMKCLTFLLNYNLEKLFNNNENQCELFLKTCFLKLNELFFVNDNLSYQSIDEDVEWFLNDLKQFLRSLYLNGLSFKYLSNKKFFNFIKKREFIYKFVETHLYSLASTLDSQSPPITPTSSTSLTSLDSASSILSSSSLVDAALFDKNTCPIQNESNFYAEPLSLSSLCKIKIKSTIHKLDSELINKLSLPNQLIRYLSNELATGLPKSYARVQMNNTFNIL
jgi:hypothetical protein